MSGGERPAPEDATTEHRAVAPEASPGTVHVDRSAFGRHQGLFVVNQGPKAGARYALDSDVVSVGRDPDSDIFLDDITVSRRHAEVARDGARYSIRHAGSLNRPYVHRRPADIDALAARQLALLDAAWSMLAPSGRLVYASCSVLSREGPRQVARFLERHHDAEPVEIGWGRACGPGRQILPGEGDMDGFFHACVSRTGP